MPVPQRDFLTLRKKLDDEFEEDSEDYLTDVRNVSQINYKKNPYARIHFTDVRQDYNKANILCANNDLLQFKNALIDEFENIKSLKNPVDLSDKLLSYANNIIAVLQEMNDILNGEVNPRNKLYRSDILVKELEKLKRKNIKYFQILKKYYQNKYNTLITFLQTSGEGKVLKNGDPKYTDGEQKLTFKTSSDLEKDFIYVDFDSNEYKQDTMNNYFLIAQNLLFDNMQNLQEMYTLSRIFKYDDNSEIYQNNIIFVGQLHIDFIENFLREIGYQAFNFNVQEEQFYRCIEAFDFNDFFSKQKNLTQ
jgi:hypothetical protein